MTFLELVQDAALKSGTFPSKTSITSVVSQGGRKGQIVDYVRQAWEDIQTSKRDWFWLRAEFTSSAIVDGDGEYTATDLGVATRFSRWRFNEDRWERSGWTIYKTASGLSDESPLAFMPWDEFRECYLEGVQTKGKPLHFTISPTRAVRLGPVPDGSYTLRGERMKRFQTLAADGDVPECPEDYHSVIVWTALTMLTEVDEALVQLQTWRGRAAAAYSLLSLDQSPGISMGAPLA